MKVLVDGELHEDEVKKIIDSEVAAWDKIGKEIASIHLSLDGDEVIVETFEKSPIKRVRRITGYLSNIENFNTAKRAECNDRYVHDQ